VGQSPVDCVGSGGRAPPSSQTAREREHRILTSLLAYAGEAQPAALGQALLGQRLTLHDVLTMGPCETAGRQLSLKTRHILDVIGQALAVALSGSAFDLPLISSSQALHDLLRFEMGALRRERLRVLYLNAGQHLVADRILSEGSINSVSIQPREIIREALLCDATDFIVVHNHPSNCSAPSPADLELTARVSAAAALCNIRLLDHLIVTRSGVCSLRAEGLLGDVWPRPPQGGLR
jgi:DNA repair protein RadC